jgi:signal transduction histidine kinase
VPPVLREHEVLSYISVVIDPQGNPFGTLAAASTKRRRFAEDDISFMQSVANVLGTAVERCNWDERLEAARKAERSRVARDLHDEALQELTDSLALAVMARSATAGADHEHWAGLIAALQRVDQQLRSAIYDLGLGANEGRPFAELLADLVSIQAGIAVDGRIELHGLDVLPAGSLGHRGAEILHIVREAVTNARRHSGAPTVRVDAGASTGDTLRVEVSDDGRWPDREVALRTRRGTGIKGMFERAELLGAELRIEARPGGGTRVSLELVLPAEAPDG